MTDYPFLKRKIAEADERVRVAEERARVAEARCAEFRKALDVTTTKLDCIRRNLSTAVAKVSASDRPQIQAIIDLIRPLGVGSA